MSSLTWNGFARYRWLAMGAAWLVCLLTWYYLLVDKDKYTVAAVVEVVARQPARGPAESPGEASDPYLVALRELLGSERLLADAIGARDPGTGSGIALPPDEEVARLREHLKVRTEADARTFEISFSHPDESESVLVMERLVTSLARRFSSDQDLRDLDRQINDQQQRVAAADERLARFKSENAGLLPGEVSALLERLSEERSVLQSMRLALDDATGSAPPPLTEPGSRLRNAQEVPDPGAAGAPPPAPTDLRSPSASRWAGADAGELARMIAQREPIVQELEELAGRAPAIEAEYARLTGEFAVAQTAYSDLLNRRDQARQLGSVAGVEFAGISVISAPRVRLTHTTRQLILMQGAGLLAGMIAGAFLAVALSLWNPVVSTPEALRAATGLPVIGSLGETWLDDRRARRKAGTILYLVSGSALVLVYIATILGRDELQTFLG